MKRAMVVSVLLLATLTVCAAQSTIWIDRVEENGRLLIPLRGVFEHYGAEISWQNAPRIVTVEAPALSISMQIDSLRATLNGETRMLDAPPRIMNGRTYIPLRFVAEALGEKVAYEGDRVVLPTMGLTLLIRGEATGAEQSDTMVGKITMTQPAAGARIGPRVEVRGTAPGGSFLVIDTEVRAQKDDELIKVVPGIRHSVPANGAWHFAISAPSMPEQLQDGPLYYVIRAYPGGADPSQGDRVKVFRASP